MCIWTLSRRVFYFESAPLSLLSYHHHLPVLCHRCSDYAPLAILLFTFRLTADIIPLFKLAGSTIEFEMGTNDINYVHSSPILALVDRSITLTALRYGEARYEVLLRTRKAVIGHRTSSRPSRRLCCLSALICQDAYKQRWQTSAVLRFLMNQTAKALYGLWFSHSFGSIMRSYPKMRV